MQVIRIRDTAVEFACKGGNETVLTARNSDTERIARINLRVADLAFRQLEFGRAWAW